MQIDPERITPVCGDVVQRKGEKLRLVVAYADAQANELAWFGWPEGMEPLSDYQLVERCSQEQHDQSVSEWLDKPHLRDNGSEDFRVERIRSLYRQESPDTSTPSSRRVIQPVPKHTFPQTPDEPIDPELAEALKRSGVGIDQVVEDRLREALGVNETIPLVDACEQLRKERDEVLRQLRWSVVCTDVKLGDVILVACVSKARAESLCAAGRLDTPGPLGRSLRVMSTTEAIAITANSAPPREAGSGGSA